MGKGLLGANLQLDGNNAHGIPFKRPEHYFGRVLLAVLQAYISGVISVNCEIFDPDILVCSNSRQLLLTGDGRGGEV